jgi:adenylosuccinate synthase
MSGNIKVVIGANYGDEGKGLMTDYLSRTSNADIVVRFNGGAQAGHTVVTPEGSRHVFSHFGSGTLAGVPTYLSRFFITNPIIFNKEYDLIKQFNPKVSMDIRCPVTTPWDMIFNQYLEERRGASKHGSCGMGIGTTIDRSTLYLLTLYITDIVEKNREGINAIRDYYRERIIVETNAEPSTAEIDDRYIKLMNDDNITEVFYADVDLMLEHCSIVPLAFNTAVFEGAQGLGLDQHMGTFPNVTRSNCGMRNVIDLQREIGFDISEIVYVTRTYMTRHGAGPMEEMEFTDLPAGIVDDTNVVNSWQGAIRFAAFGKKGWDKVFKRVHLDIQSNNLDIGLVRLAITHMDQYPNKHLIEADYLSNGPTYKDVTKV